MRKKKHKHVARRAADGRVHLALHRDAAGNSHLTLSTPVFADAWQNEVTLGAANTTLAMLGEAPSAELVVALAERAMAATSRLTEGLLSRASQGSVACKAGCDHCCHQSVGATAPEVFAIAAHLRSALTTEQLEAFKTQLTARAKLTRGLSADERFSPELPCLFLSQGSCSIYEVRPLVCRGMNSLDAVECERRLRDPEARAEFLALGAAGHCYLEPIRAAQSVSAGLQLGIAELYGLDMRPLDLTAALELLLSSTSALEGSWLRGGRPLETAVHSGD
jgi:Fe-S-cluster containining protein